MVCLRFSIALVVECIVDKHVSRGIVTSKAEIKPTHEGDGLVNDAKLFVMRPVERSCLEVTRRALHEDVAMKTDETLLGVVRVRGREVVRHLVVDDDEDLDSFLGLLLEHIVETPLGMTGPAQIEFGTEPPVVNKDTILGHHERLAQVPIVITSIGQPLRGHVETDGRKAVEAVGAAKDVACGHLLHRDDELLHHALVFGDELELALRVAKVKRMATGMPLLVVRLLTFVRVRILEVTARQKGRLIVRGLLVAIPFAFIGLFRAFDICSFLVVAVRQAVSDVHGLLVETLRSLDLELVVHEEDIVELEAVGLVDDSDEALADDEPLGFVRLGPLCGRQHALLVLLARGARQDAQVALLALMPATTGKGDGQRRDLEKTCKDDSPRHGTWFCG